MMALSLAPDADLASAALGSLSIGRLTATGILHAAAILASVALGAGLARRRGLLPRLIIETHAIAVPVAIVLARAGALAASFPAFLHDMERLARVATSPPSPLPALVGVAVLLVLMAWASGRPRALADCMAPGGVLIACALLVDVAQPMAMEHVAIALIAAIGSPVAYRLAGSAERPGEAALVAGESLVLALTVTLVTGPIPSIGLVACAVMLGSLVSVHVLLRARTVSPSVRPA